MKELSHGPSNQVLMCSLQAKLPVQRLSIGSGVGFVSSIDNREKIALMKSSTVILKKLGLTVQNDQVKLEKI